MNLLIQNTLILPITEPGLSFRGDIGIADGRIQFVGKADPSFVAQRVIDGSHHLTMPALVNAHTHLSMILMRNYKDNLPSLEAWLGEIFPIEDTLTEADILTASRLAVAEMIQSGVTTFCDMYFHSEATAQAVLEGGIRANLGLTLFGDEASSKARIAERAEALLTFRDDPSGRISLSVAPHAVYTCTKETYQLANRWARKHDALLHTHLSETRKEVDDSLAAHGLTPLFYLQSIGALEDVRSIFAHGVFLNDDEIAHLAQMDAAIVHNPSSNLKLNCGIAPTSLYLKQGLHLALGTDGASSNNNLNMVEEMHLAALLGRLDGTLSAWEVVKMATIDGARALGLDKKIGSIEEGKEADLIMFDLAKSHLTPLNDPFSSLVYSAQASDISTVLCKGEVLMQDRTLTHIDVETLIEETNRAWKDVLKRR